MSSDTFRPSDGDDDSKLYASETRKSYDTLFFAPPVISNQSVQAIAANNSSDSHDLEE